MKQSENAVNNNKSEKNTSLTTIMPNLFGTIDFSTLNASIDALGKGNENLNAEEKGFAIGIVTKWEKNVIEKLFIRRNDADAFIKTLDAGNSVVFIGDDEFQQIAAACGLNDLYEEYDRAVLAYRDLKQSPPLKVERNVMDSMENFIDADTAFQNDVLKYNLALKKANNTVDLRLYTLKKALNSTDQCKELTLRLSKFIRSISKLQLECEEKSQLAQLNITISSTFIREKLKTMLDFSIKI